MKVEIFSRAAMEKFIQTAYPKNTAVICFYYKNKPDFYPTACNLIYYVNIPDIDKELLEKYGYTYDTYIEDSDRVYGFFFCGHEIKFKVKDKDLTVISVEKRML